MAPSLRHRSRVLTFFWALFRLLLLLPITLFGLVVLALGLALSPWGTGLLLDAGARQGLYQLESHEGAPLDRLVLNGLKLEAGPARVAASRIELAWADDCLLDGRLCLDTLAVEGARIRLAAGEGDEAAEESGGEPLELRGHLGGQRGLDGDGGVDGRRLQAGPVVLGFAQGQLGAR